MHGVVSHIWLVGLAFEYRLTSNSISGFEHVAVRLEPMLLTPFWVAEGYNARCDTTAPRTKEIFQFMRSEAPSVTQSQASQVQNNDPEPEPKEATPVQRPEYICPLACTRYFFVKDVAEEKTSENGLYGANRMLSAQV
jgi:hypothetical protein